MAMQVYYPMPALLMVQIFLCIIFIRSVRPVLSNSDSLTTLLLEGLAMDIKNVKLLAKVKLA